ncbi:MAG: superoxide dismutase family protein [Betaproteobacteria bacterium]|nr:superoxide dismutase family protein [Betaproteobacteria bacterium]
MKKSVISVVCGAVLVAGCAAMDEKGNPTATARLEPRSGSQVQGLIKFEQIGDVVRITGEVTGHTKGPKGFHIHEKGDCSAPDAMSAGGHFNPGKSKHGGPYDPVKHAGDLGNLAFNDQGVAKLNFTVGDISVSRDRRDGIIGRAVVVHVQPDDFKTDPTGNAGGRAACAVITGHAGSAPPERPYSY